VKAGYLIPSVTPKTIADGLLTSLSERTFAHIRRDVAGIVTVSEDSIVKAMRLIWEIMKIIVEPSAAVSYAAIADAKREFGGHNIAIILTGGNLDLDSLPWLQ
jgi:threonine dehydratase